MAETDQTAPPCARRNSVSENGEQKTVEDLEEEQDVTTPQALSVSIEARASNLESVSILPRRILGKRPRRKRSCCDDVFRVR